jgi:hypothetical protein
VDAAYTGDEIRVAAGTYADLNVQPLVDDTATDVVTQVVYISKTITLQCLVHVNFAPFIVVVVDEEGDERRNRQSAQENSCQGVGSFVCPPSCPFRG